MTSSSKIGTTCKEVFGACFCFVFLLIAGLSFLGIGVPADMVTWGSQLNQGRSNLEAWWVIVFPGIAIFFTITIYNTIAEAMRDALDPKLKS